MWRGSALAYRGLLKDVEEVYLHEVNLSTIPTKHLISLMSSVTKTVDIIYYDITGCDLVSILDSLQCTEIGLGFNSLCIEEEAEALVRAMESRVERLYFHDTLDMCVNTRKLTEYSGQGRCKVIICEDVDDVNFINELFCWVGEKGWYRDHIVTISDEDVSDNDEYSTRFSFTLKKKEEALDFSVRT